MYVLLPGRQRNRDRETSAIHWFISQKPTTGELGQVEVRSLELIPGLPCRWQGRSYLSHHFLLHRVALVLNKLGKKVPSEMDVSKDVKERTAL